MRRAVARGRILPQSLSTDPRYGRLSLKAQVLYPLMWINADDQGRLSGDPDEIKYAACPSVREILADDIPALLQEMETRGMIKVYSTSKTRATQFLDWWDVQKLQWAYPSEYPPPEGWQDKLRYHASPTQIVIDNWASKAPNSLPSVLPSALGSTLQPSLTTAGELAEEIRPLLMTLPETVDRLVEHEVIKDTLAKLGQRKGFIARPEVTTEMGRVDLLWEEPTGKLVAGFEIDIYEPREKSLTKLKDLACPHSFVILRSNPEPFQWEQDILLIGLGAGGKKTKSRGEPLPSLENEKEEKKEREGGRGNLPSALGSKTTATKPRITGEEIPRSESEIEESLCEGDREIISVWRSVKGFKMSLADASALVASLRTEFPDVEILAQSKVWAARKLSEPLKPTSRPSSQIWNFMRLARQFAQERREREQGKGQRAKVHPREAFRGGKW